MATRYLAAIATGGCLELDHMQALAARNAFTLVMAGPALAVMTNRPGLVLRSADDSRAVLGTMFSRGPPSNIVRPIDVASWDPNAWSSQKMLSSFWGEYIAISPSEGGIQVVRDPAGGLPCYLVAQPSMLCLCSDVDVAIDSGLLAPAIDWPAVGRHLLRPALRFAETALARLEELPAGFGLQILGSRVRRFQCWSPWDHVGRHATTPSIELQALLAATVKDCVRSRASQYGHLLLSLSGGLDSSIVAASLAGAGVPVTCVTMVADGIDGDERRYARLVSTAFAFEQIERDYRLADIDLARSSAEHLPRPVGSPARRVFDLAHREVADSVGADAHFSGNGGDNVFCLMQSATPLADRIRASGPGANVLTTLDDIERLTGASYGMIAWRALRRLLRSPRYIWKADRRFLRAAVAKLDPGGIAHPWLSAPDRALPGDAAHIAMLLRPQNFAEGSRRAPCELVTPLLSQPIVELCLGIPSWRWCAGGRDRAPARGAFADSLPSEIVDRRSKGGPAAFFHQILAEHRSVLRDHLRFGCLADHGLIDPKAITEFFDSTALHQGDSYVRALALADAESWLRNWIVLSG